MADPWAQYPEVGQPKDPWGAYPEVGGGYIPVPAENYGDDETILDERTGQTFKAPSGAGQMTQNILNDTTFSPPASSTLEEASAVGEKAMANVALVLVMNGAISADEAAPYIAERSKALAYAQQNQPEYMDAFFEKWNGSGPFGKAAAVFTNPAAVGRGIVTQAPNSVIPLLMTWAGGKAGTVTGASVGAAVGAPVAGGAVGGVGGSVLGAYQASKMMGAAETLDEIAIKEYGVDMTDAESILEFLSDPEKINGAKIRAERAGADMALVDAAFQVFGGQFLKMFKNASKVKKVAAGAADIATQSTGETLGEATRQYSAFKDIDWDEALYEGLTSTVQATGEVAIGATTGAVKEKLSPAPTATEPPPVTTETPEVKQVIDMPVEGVAAEESKAIVTDFLEGREVDISKYDEAKQAAIMDVLERARPAQPAIIKGRVRKLDADMETTLNELDAVEREIEVARSEGRGIKRLRDRAKKLSEQWFAMDEERGGLLTVEDQISETRDTVNKDITVKGRDLVRLEQRVTKESMRAVNKAFRDARVATKRDVRDVQKTLIDAIRNSGLSKQDQASFINTISATQTQEQLTKRAPKIQQRIEQKLNDALRRDTTAKINKLLSRLKKTKVVAVDYIERIEKLVSAYDTKRMSDAVRADLEATARYLQENPTASVPTPVTKKLERLTKKRNEEIATQELVDLYEEMRKQVGQGAVKLRLMRQQRERRMKQRLAELAQDANPLTEEPLLQQPLSRQFTTMEKVKNKFIEARNASYRIGLNKNPMDVIFDIMDGTKNYTGAHSRVFKQTIDTAFSRYLDLKDQTTRTVKDLADELKLDGSAYRRIGAYAVLQQEGGKQKLLDTGFTAAEINSLTLNEAEQRMYTMMREKLDSLLPALKEVMRVVYNKDVEAVQDYFPFLTDFSKMEDMAVIDRIGNQIDFKPKQKNVDAKQTIKRTLGKQAVRIDAMDVFLTHVDNTAYLIEMGQDIRELGDLAQSNEYAEIAGDLGQKVSVDWISLLAKKGGADNKLKALEVLRKNAGFAMLGFKLSTVLVQTTALLDGAAMIGGGYAARGLSAVASRDWRQFMYDHFPEVRNRVGDDPAYLNMGGDGVIGDIREFSMIGIKTIDSLIASSVAAGAYMKYMRENNLPVDFDKPDAEGVAYAQLMMRRSQSSAFAKDAAPLISQGKLTGNASLDKLLLQFQSFILNRWSMIEHDMLRGGFGRGRTAEAVNIAAFLILSVTAEEAMRAGLRALFGQEPDEDETIQEVALNKALQQVPFVSSIVSSFEYGSVPVPALALLAKTFEEGKYALQSGDTEKQLDHILKAGVYTAAVTAGVPGALQTIQLYDAAKRAEDNPWR